MSTRDTTTLLTQLRAVRDLTNTEIQIAETRIAQARTEAVRRELSENAENGRARVEAIESAIRELGGVPAVVGPFLGRVLAMFKALGEQTRPFEEALLGDLSLEHQLLDRSRYIKALAEDAKLSSVVTLADGLIKAHTATVNWLTTVLAEDALGGPAALRRTPLQVATGTAIKVANIPASLSARGIDRVLDTFRSAPPALEELLARGAHAREVAAKTFSASRDAALQTAEQVARREGAAGTADALRSVRTATGVLEPGELPIRDYDDLNVSQTVAAVKELDSPSELRAVLAYEEAHKNRQGVVSATQTRLAAIAPELTGLN
ncbi:ferritin-like domain-containing protein [Nocardia yamanashiensis]|uniref:ferritin-like domain-containing protein n=1 Tax=Nocardia yamanashiensis TaxID=209247 RepID=UPI001E605C15|nr:ferritin-like domain-containing protein [Nocardia yamanashiensis]UGT44194.1 ferritin-like domain-containing protein [Nocardia yamanashiensis]